MTMQCACARVSASPSCEHVTVLLDVTSYDAKQVHLSNGRLAKFHNYDTSIVNKTTDVIGIESEIQIFKQYSEN